VERFELLQNNFICEADGSVSTSPCVSSANSAVVLKRDIFNPAEMRRGDLAADTGAVDRRLFPRENIRGGRMETELYRLCRAADQPRGILWHSGIRNFAVDRAKREDDVSL
jgi:hypothetical protein